MTFQEETPRKAVVLLAMLLGFGFAALLSLPLNRYGDEPAMTMAAAPSALTKLQPTRAWQSMPSRASQFLQPVSAVTSQKELERMINLESQMESSSGLVKQEKRRELLAAAALAFAGASAKERAAVAAEMKHNGNRVAEIGEGEPYLVNLGWAA